MTNQQAIKWIDGRVLKLEPDQSTIHRKLQRWATRLRERNSYGR